MRTFKNGLLLSAIVIATNGAMLPGSANAVPGKSLVTAQQQALDKLAMTLQGDPAVKAAREAVIKRWREQPAATTADGEASLVGAVDEVVYHALRAAVADEPTKPVVTWTLAPAYSLGKQKIPGSRLAGDNPDRIYRFAAMDSALRYEIRGQRGAKPAQHEFSFEATGSISMVQPAKVALYSKDIDVAADGRFVVTADSTPANGRRNHLQLPEGTRAVMIRDTLPDWSADYNQITVVRLDGSDRPARSHEELASEAARIIGESAEGPLKITDTVLKNPPNVVVPFVRPYDWGVPGNVVAINRFSLQKDEALVVTLLPSGANYVAFQLTDAWSRSIDYWHHTSSLSDHQVKANADGSITFVLSAQDPGVHNWLDNNGVRDGVYLVRWELFPQPLPPGNAPQLVREARVVKLSELGTALPAGMARVTPAQRKQQLKARTAEFAKRIATK